MRLRSAPLLILAALALPACGDDDRPADAGSGGGGHGEAGVDAGVDAGPAGCIPASGECTTPGGDECCEGYLCRASSSGRAFCVEPDDTCFVGAEDGCCLDDADCAGDDRCVAMECRPDGDGVCKPPSGAGVCWTDADCPAGQACDGVVLCPCSTDCFAPDMPGTCA